MPGIRPDTRRVSKARVLSQTLADTEVVGCHISALKQDCWSWCRTVYSYVCDWYQTDQHIRFLWADGYSPWKSPPRIPLMRLISKVHKINFGATGKALFDFLNADFFPIKNSTLLFLFLLCCSLVWSKGLVHRQICPIIYRNPTQD